MSESDPSLAAEIGNLARENAAPDPEHATAEATSAGTPAAPPESGARPEGQSASAKAVSRQLPSYAKSLLKVAVPVTVTLASKKQLAGRIVELGPGSIIQFDKSCDEALRLEVCGQAVAEGEAVKVGEKFGIRVTSIVLPDERFRPLRPRA